eukprot:jgi/Mesvir1/24628/Mv21936-RA.3
MILSTPRVSRAMAQFREVISSPSGSFTQLAKLHGLFLAKRHLSSAAERDRMEFDMVIVGAGPAGLSAAIRAKQLAKQRGADVSVCVVEKGAQVGAHTLSGNVFEPRALDELLPNWRELNAPITVPVTLDTFSFLTEGRSIRLPTPPQMHNKGNYVVSLSEVVRWLGSQAEEMGVEVYPGFAASEVLFREDGAVCGVATTDTGIGKNGKPRPNFARGVELRGTVSLLAEGCRGSLSESIIERFSLREKAGAQHQTYGLGIKEVWEVRPEKHSPGTVLHTVGWPLPPDTYGGSFLYHMADNKVALGLVVGLDYKNPYLNPYQEFQVSWPPPGPTLTDADVQEVDNAGRLWRVCTPEKRTSKVPAITVCEPLQLRYHSQIYLFCDYGGKCVLRGTFKRSECCRSAAGVGEPALAIPSSYPAAPKCPAHHARLVAQPTVICPMIRSWTRTCCWSLFAVCTCRHRRLHTWTPESAASRCLSCGSCRCCLINMCICKVYVCHKATE